MIQYARMPCHKYNIVSRGSHFISVFIHFGINKTLKLGIAHFNSIWYTTYTLQNSDIPAMIPGSNPVFTTTGTNKIEYQTDQSFCLKTTYKEKMMEILIVEKVVTQFLQFPLNLDVVKSASTSWFKHTILSLLPQWKL